MPLDPLSLANLAFGGAQMLFGGIQTIFGKKQESDAERIARENIRPVANTSALYDDLVGRMSAESQYGLDLNARTFANENNNNNFTAGLSAMLMSGGNPNSVSALYGTATDASEKLAIADSDRKWQKVSALAGIVDKQNEAKTQDWLYNYDAPYKDKARLAAQKEMMGYNQKMTGADYAMGAMIRTGEHFIDAETAKKAAATAGSRGLGADIVSQSQRPSTAYQAYAPGGLPQLPATNMNTYTPAYNAMLPQIPLPGMRTPGIPGSYLPGRLPQQPGPGMRIQTNNGVTPMSHLFSPTFDPLALNPALYGGG